MLLDRIHQAIEQDAENRRRGSERAQIEERVDRLTPREREVMGLVASGKPNRQIAGELGLSEKTVEVHRARIMSKMGAHSVAELVRMALTVEGP